MRTGPTWKRREYDACVHAGPRCKKQTLETDIEELAAVEGKCAHVHDDKQWDPWQDSRGKWHYPGHEEAEFTAALAFTIALACTWYVIKVNGFPIAVPRPPHSPSVQAAE